MERAVYQNLLTWKSSPRRQPLILQGARQTGKTYLLKEFGRKEYRQCLYCNLEEDPELEKFFQGSLEPRRLVENLTIYKKQDFDPKQDILIFDEIQASNQALNSLKYFCEEAPGHHVVAAGSLLGIKISRPKSFPVGKVSFLSLYPMTFPEFLTALGEDRYCQLLANLAKPEPLPLPFHEELTRLLRQYFLVGGMPAAVRSFVETRGLEEVRRVHEEILRSYVFDFAKHAPSSDIPKLSLIWESIPGHLSRENKKFIFTALAGTARAREYQDALQWLDDARLIHRSYAVETIQQPLQSFILRNIFKVFALDVGLLASQARIPLDTFIRPQELFTTFHGALVENYVAQQLAALNQRLLYWRSNSHQAEVDFLFERDARIYPLEVKAGVNPKSKSLAAYDQKFHPMCLARSTLLNLKKDGRMLNVPLYALHCLDTLLDQQN